MAKTKRHGWRPMRAPRCSMCSGPFHVRATPSGTEELPTSNLWTEESGFLTVHLWYCVRCDPNLARSA